MRPFLSNDARIRLAVTYLAIIMALSFGFSALFYHQSVREAKGNLQSQQVLLKDYLFFTTPEGVRRIQDQQLDVFRHSLLKRLAVLNLGMLVFGGTLSYFLARRSLRPLEDALAVQGRFTSDAAHELRTPLTAMQTEIEVGLRSGGLKVSDYKRLLESNLEEVGKLETLTSALLRLARSSEKVDVAAWQDCKLAGILQSARDRLSDKGAKRGISITLPKTKAIVRGDPDQLVELFVPLIGNAVKYSHDNGKVEVKVSQGDKLRVDIIDHGVGIASQDLPHIFERFYRVDPARSRQGAEGYGLGLSLAEAIASAHGGEIKVRSRHGKGSTFSVYLPKY